MIRQYQSVYRVGVAIVLASFGTSLATETSAQSRVSTPSSKAQAALETAASRCVSNHTITGS